jgi:hypothetical protein
VELSAAEWTVATSVGTSSVVAAFVTYWLKARGEERQRSAAKQALQAEIDHIEEHARGYLRIGTPRAPSWRPSTMIFPQALTRLTALGAMHRGAVAALLAYYGNVEAFSRSLDMVDEHMGTSRHQREVERALIKATLLVSAEHIQELLGEPSLNPYRRHLQKRVDVHGNRMPLDKVRRELALVPGTPFINLRSSAP